jgi:23S rRNA pseudouridine1911/1915/1917 synthase
LPDLKGIGGEQRPGIVHRIDKFTSGLLVIAKTEETHQKLVEMFSKHELHRSYWALCYGSLGSAGSAPLRVETFIGRNPSNRLKMTTTLKGGKKAISHFKVLENYRLKNKNKPFACWVEATLETGRTHQIRVHLTSKNCSILGDPLYGKPTENQPKWTEIPPEVQKLISELPGQALHARSLGFAHPITGEKLFFETDPPLAFQALHAKLKEYL